MSHLLCDTPRQLWTGNERFWPEKPQISLLRKLAKNNMAKTSISSSRQERDFGTPFEMPQLADQVWALATRHLLLSLFLPNCIAVRRL